MTDVMTATAHLNFGFVHCKCVLVRRSDAQNCHGHPDVKLKVMSMDLLQLAKESKGLVFFTKMLCLL